MELLNDPVFMGGICFLVGCFAGYRVGKIQGKFDGEIEVLEREDRLLDGMLKFLKKTQADIDSLVAKNEEKESK